nr:hypothetical protein GCM10017745_19710 [Saccharothrix mutabilis subsp. capreolus]
MAGPGRGAHLPHPRTGCAALRRPDPPHAGPPRPAARPPARLRHPGLAPPARPDGAYRLPLGDAANLVPVIERAMTTFAPRLYRGIQDEGFTVGLS